MRVWLLVGVVACSQALPPKPPSEIVWIEQPTARPSHAAFSTVPADLVDDKELARIRHRVRVRWLHRASPILGESAEPVIARAQANEVDQIMPVIDESQTEIRVVAEDDDARLAMWIDRRQTWPTLLVPMQLGDREGRVTKTAGVFVETGAPIDVAFGKDRLRHVTVRDPDLVVDGWVPSSAIGNVWIHVPRENVKTKADTKFAARAQIRAAPDARAPILATVLAGGVAGVIHTHGAWTDVEIVREHVRIRGFVRAGELAPNAESDLEIGTVGGHGFGMSHAHRIVVPAGTCLFDAANGQVVGVQLVQTTRYGERDIDVDRWSRVYVDSPWAVFGFFVHDTGSDPKQPVWESCGPR